VLFYKQQTNKDATIKRIQWCIEYL
jgi:hypothetical protein